MTLPNTGLTISEQNPMQIGLNSETKCTIPTSYIVITAFAFLAPNNARYHIIGQLPIVSEPGRHIPDEDAEWKMNNLLVERRQTANDTNNPRRIAVTFRRRDV